MNYLKFWKISSKDMKTANTNERKINMGNIIAICNQKGGVGKTTTTFNLGASLAQKHNKKVLLIDLDPQANLSEYLGFTGDDKPTMTGLISSIAQNQVLDSEKLSDCIRHNEEYNLHYIPSDINLASAEMMLITTIARESVLKRILSTEVVQQFDFVLIDCLPSLGILLINALVAAQKMIVPVQTQKFSMDGLEALLSLYNQIRCTINPTLEIMGILPTLVDYTNVSKNRLNQLSERFKSELFNTVIHRAIKAAMSAEDGKPLCTTKSKVGEEYNSFTLEVLERC